MIHNAVAADSDFAVSETPIIPDGFENLAGKGGLPELQNIVIFLHGKRCDEATEISLAAEYIVRGLKGL